MGCTSSKENVKGDIEDIKKQQSEIKTNKVKNEGEAKNNEKEKKEEIKKEEVKNEKVIKEDVKKEDVKKEKVKKEEAKNEETKKEETKKEEVKKEEVQKEEIHKEEEVKKEEVKKKEEKKENDIKTSSQQKQLAFNKELCNSIANDLPKRTQTNLQSLKDLIKSKTNDLSQKEQSYIVFLWICDNISYDADSFFAGRKVDVTPGGVFKTGLTVCSGYARLYKEIASYINLEVECVSCYAKGVGYEAGKILNKTDHEYNVIKLDDKWYPIDSTWGAGHIEGKKFLKAYNEFYFLVDPELLIKTHFPANEKWQLTKKKYTLEEFFKWPIVKNSFYLYGFEKYSPEIGVINLTDSNSLKFIVYGKDMSQKTGICNIYLLQNNVYQQLTNLTLINFYEDKFEVDCIFNQKGKYKIKIFGNSVRGQKNNSDILEYIVNVSNNAKNKLSFPKTFKGKEDINIIEPIYNNLKSGEKVKFKIKSNLDKIIIIDGKWNYLEKNEEGYFEFETTIQSPKGKSVFIGKPKPPKSCDHLVSYDVI